MLGPDKFCFLNETHCLAQIGWDGTGLTKLWRYNLHYFDDLNAYDAARRIEWHLPLLRRWIEENRPAIGSGWEPYPTSLRIVNWIEWALSGNTLPHEALHSLSVQARWLMCRLEYHLSGNHLFSNAKALVFAGSFFQGLEGERWLSTGSRILESQLSEQILDDGAHFELSTMYHALAMEDLLDLINLANTFPDRSQNIRLCKMLWSRLNAMRGWLAAMCHPDGEIAFFNDAAIGIAPSPAELEAYCVRLGLGGSPDTPVGHMRSSNYVRLENGTALLLFDAAQIGPDHLPGHAHADTLSFELSVHGRRLLVNSGTSRYGTDAERSRQRGTAAHNTVVVGGQNSSEVWSGFRVARRARPMALQVAGNTIECSHDGYRRLPGKPIHRRRMALEESSVDINDEVLGGKHDAYACFHFHPDWMPRSAQDGQSGEVIAPDGQAARWTVGRGHSMVERSTYHREFGAVFPTHRLVVHLVDGRANVTFRW